MCGQCATNHHRSCRRRHSVRVCHQLVKESVHCPAAWSHHASLFRSLSMSASRYPACLPALWGARGSEGLDCVDLTSSYPCGVEHTGTCRSAACRFSGFGRTRRYSVVSPAAKRYSVFAPVLVDNSHLHCTSLSELAGLKSICVQRICRDRLSCSSSACFDLAPPQEN